MPYVIFFLFFFVGIDQFIYIYLGDCKGKSQF